MRSNKKSKQVVNVYGDVDERMVPSKHSGSDIYGEHIARYMAACNVVEGKHVLDIACGSGYGTAILSDHANSVVGVDISKEAIDFAKKEYKKVNVTYKKSDGVTIPFDDNTFDVVVSFETIEHLEDYVTFMSEIKRVLKKDGLLVISTPNKIEFTEGNHFHIHEFAFNEFSKLTKKYYSEIKPFYQSTYTGNLIGSDRDMSSEWISKVDVQQLSPIAPEKFLYFFFLCSNRPISESIKTRYTISRHLSDKIIYEKNLLTENHINNLENIIKLYKDDCNKKNDSIKGYKSELEKIKSGRVYKLWEAVKTIKRR